MRAKFLIRFRSLPLRRCLWASVGLVAILAAPAAASFPAEPGVRDVTGILLPEREETLASTVLGRVAAIHFREGSWVEKGAVIVELDNERERLEVERRRLLWESRIEEEIARERAALAETEFNSAKRLYDDRRSISLDELNKKELEWKLARAELEQIGLMKQRERIEYRMAERDLAERMIRAPGAGLVAEVLIEVGEICEPRQPLVRIMDVRSCLLEANVDAMTAARLTPGSVVRVDIETLEPEQAREGEIVFLAPYVDAASGLRTVRLRLSNEDGRLTPGVNGIIRLTRGIAELGP